MTVLDKPVVVGANDHPGDGVLTLASVLVAIPDGAETLVLSAELVVGAWYKVTSRHSTGLSGSVLNARRGPRSGGRVLTLTAAPP